MLGRAALLLALSLPPSLTLSSAVGAQVVERLPTKDKVVALTFDACEARGKPAFFDKKILATLEAQKVPFTIFVTGLFAQRNRAELARLAKSELVEVENHSFDHPQHMERLSPEAIRRQVEDTDRVVEEITGRAPRYFRFPAGNYDGGSLHEVQDAGHRVVHWSWASGDPAAGLTPEHLKSWVLSKTRPGDILIFHINGRAPATAEALPVLLAELKRRGYGFVRLDQLVK